MHPFSLNEEEVKQVGGGYINPFPITDTNYFEESGMEPPPATTLALGEEGALPPEGPVY